MAKKKTPVERSAYTISIELKEIRDELNVLKLAEKSCADELRKRMIAGDEQDIFKFMPVTSLKISDTEKAFKWAKKYAPTTITINTALARKVFLGDALTGSMGTPESAGFELVTVDHLKEIRRSGPESGYDIA